MTVRHKERVKNTVVKLLIIIFIISIVTTVLFGLLTLLGVFKAFSKIALIVSLCIMVPFLIVIAVEGIKESSR